MAITYVNEVTAVLEAGTGSTSVSLPTSLENDIWIIGVSYDAYDLNAAAMGDAAVAAGWTLHASDATDAPDYFVIHKRMGSTPETAVSIENSNHASGWTGNVIGQLFRGVDTASTGFDVTPTFASGESDTGGTDPDNAAITNATENAMIVLYAAGDDDTSTLGGAPSGYTNTTFQSTTRSVADGPEFNDTTASMASKIVTTKDVAENPAVWDWVDFEDFWIAYTFALKPAAADVTGTFSNNYGNVQAGLSGLNWAFFDENIGVLTAPTATGAFATTDLNGAFSIDVIGTSKSMELIGLLLALTVLSGWILQVLGVVITSTLRAVRLVS
jgi:hypothetical protein